MCLSDVKYTCRICRRPNGKEGEFFVQLFLDPDANVKADTESLLNKMFMEQNIVFDEVSTGISEYIRGSYMAQSNYNFTLSHVSMQAYMERAAVSHITYVAACLTSTSNIITSVYAQGHSKRSGWSGFGLATISQGKKQSCILEKASIK